ncbi:glycosyltransferase [Rhodobacteraceae bacterium D3-12]|nr:glycosyltransferase [Rhodobacteraceae bacterium D3-12]
MPAVWRERDLRRGLLEDGGAELQEMARGGTGANAIHAAIACARIAAREGDWQTAHGWLEGLDPSRDLIGLGGQADPVLLGIEAAIEARVFMRAQACLVAARRAFGALPDIALAEANMIAARGGTETEWGKPLARVFRRGGLVGVALAGSEHKPKPEPAFDRLRPIKAPRPCGQGGPLVSVIVPARDAAATIATALNSLTAQSWQSLEILVVDNGSRDDTANVVASCAARDPRIRLLDGAAEPGAYAARNIGMQNASGAFLSVLDADDWAHPQRIAEQVGLLLTQPDAVACIADWVRTTPDMRFARWWQDDGYVHPDLSSLMIRAEVLTRLGFWDRVRAGADSEYFDRIEAMFGAAAILRCQPRRPLGFGRLHPASLTQSTETRIDSLIHGARRSYVQQARRWHRSVTEGAERKESTGTAALPLPARPERRPFPVPAALALDPSDPDAAIGDDLASAGIYDDDWYLRSYPDLREHDTDGLEHYLTKGAAEGRDPGPYFSTSGYAMAQGIAPQEAAQHYLSLGRAAGLPPLPVWTGARPAAKPGRHVMVFGHQAGPALFGAERCLLSTLDRALEAGLTPTVVLPRLLDEGYLAALLERSAAVHVLPYGWRFGGVAPDARTLNRLSRLIRDSGAVEVHQNTCVLDAPLRAARLAGVPSVLHVHELPQTDPRLCADLGQSAASLRDTLLAEADRFVVPSEAVKDWLGAPQERCLILPNRADLGLFDLPIAPDNPPRVALIGSMTRRKGVQDMLAVARRLAQNGPAAEFRFIGPESSDLNRLGPLPANLRHMGYAPSPRDALLQADIVLSLSHVAESFGMSVLEALSAGRPVVCYDHGHPPKLLGAPGPDGQRPGGIVVSRGAPEAVADALRAWLSDPAALRAASVRARDHAKAMARDEPQGVFRA